MVVTNVIYGTLGILNDRHGDDDHDDEIIIDPFLVQEDNTMWNKFCAKVAKYQQKHANRQQVRPWNPIRKRTTEWIDTRALIRHTGKKKNIVGTNTPRGRQTRDVGHTGELHQGTPR